MKILLSKQVCENIFRRYDSSFCLQVFNYFSESLRIYLLGKAGIKCLIELSHINL